jgi:hypothetical protein
MRSAAAVAVARITKKHQQKRTSAVSVKLWIMIRENHEALSCSVNEAQMKTLFSSEIYLECVQWTSKTLLVGLDQQCRRKKRC